MDAVNIDLKAFTDDFYYKITGSQLVPILETLEYIHNETDVWLEITTLLIPGMNDSDEEIQTMTQWVVDKLGENVPMHFSAFHPDWKMRNIPATPPETLIRARKIALNNGVRYAYTGNVHNIEGDSTWCHACQGLLIGRDGYNITDWHLDSEGNCQHCGVRCDGVFERAPGNWGARRQPVSLQQLSVLS